MNTPDLTHATWKKSTRSDSNGGACVEVTDLPGGGTAVRDSKDRSGPILLFTAVEWHSFIEGVKDGEFDQQAAVPSGQRQNSSGSPATSLPERSR